MNELPPARWRGADVDITSIERRLSGLAKDIAAETPDLCPVRTHLFNLVVFAPSRAEAQRIARLDQLSRRHASRCIILVPDRGRAQPTIDAELVVFAARGGDGANALIYEQVVLTAHGRAGDHPGSVIIPLLIPEIPTYLWWPGNPPFGHRIFHRLVATADQVIIDSAQFADPGDALANAARVATRVCGVNDFNWLRLTPWREIFAQFFDGPMMAPYLQGIRTITVELGSSRRIEHCRRAAAGLLLLLGWVSAELGWQPETTLDEELTGDVELAVLQGERLIPIQVQFRDHGAQSQGRLMGFEVVSQPSELAPAKFRVTRSDDLERVESAVEVLGDQPVRRVVPLGIPGDERLLADVLSLTGHDRLYERVAIHASRLAGRDVWIPV